MKKVIDHLGNSYSSEKEMCENYKIAPSTFYQRYHKYNWPLDKALTVPAKSKDKTKEHSKKQSNPNEINNKYTKKQTINRNDFSVSSEFPSIEYVKYLKWQEHSLLREQLSKEVLEKLECIKQEMDKIHSQSFYFNIMDMLYTRKMKSIEMSYPNKVIIDCMKCLKHPQGLIKKIYVDFAQSKMIEICCPKE